MHQFLAGIMIHRARFCFAALGFPPVDTIGVLPCPRVRIGWPCRHLGSCSVLFPLLVVAVASVASGLAAEERAKDRHQIEQRQSKCREIRRQRESGQKGKEKVSGLVKDDYEKLYLDADDLPGMKMTQNSKGMGPDNGDKMYAKLGGKFTGLCAWEPEKSGQEVNHINRIVDLRWVFPDAASAKAYLKDQLGTMAEGQIR